MNDRRRITGVVTSNKMTKTVVVEISRTFRHPLYRKVVHMSKRVKAHDTWVARLVTRCRSWKAGRFLVISAGWSRQLSSMKFVLPIPE